MFNLLEEVVTAEHGPWAWDDLLDDLGVDGGYTAVATYEDAEFLALVGALPATTACPAGHLVGAGAATDTQDDGERTRWYGRAAIPLLALRYPVFFDGHDDARDFLATVEDVIHTEVRKLDPTADVPCFGVEDRTEADGSRTLVLAYRSSRRLCHLAEGFVLGAGDHYGQPLDVSQPSCMRRGDDVCDLVVRPA